MAEVEIHTRFDLLVDYLRHLVDDHGINESEGLWASGRDLFDALHADAHDTRVADAVAAERDAVVAYLYDQAAELPEVAGLLRGLAAKFRSGAHRAVSP